MPAIKHMTAQERATEFVRRYPNLFTEDQDFWTNALAQMIIEAEMAQLEKDHKITLKVIGEAMS